jgi:hypothetical protein
MIKQRQFECIIPFGGGKLDVIVDLEPGTGEPEDCTITLIAFDDVQVDELDLYWLRDCVMEKAREDWHGKQIDRAESLHDRREERNGDR